MLRWQSHLGAVPRSVSLPFDESATSSTPPAFGPYRVLHPIGSGVLGPVFRAFDARQDRLVAVKTFKLDLLPEQVARLTDALRAMVNAPVAHPAVVPAIDAGLEGSTPYVVLTIALGETLDVTLRQLAPASPDAALPILSAVASAIDAVWDQGGSHGALHPRDVFVSTDGRDVRVTGFGIVRALEEVGAQAPVRRPYASPERAANRPWDRRADVYALGAIAHELLTGRKPAGGGEQDGTFSPAVTPAARVAVRRVLGAALADSPDARFTTLGAFVAALEEATRGVLTPMPEIVAPPPSPAVADRPAEPDVEVPAANRSTTFEVIVPAVQAPATHVAVSEIDGALLTPTRVPAPAAAPEPIAPAVVGEPVSRATKPEPAVVTDLMRATVRQGPDLGAVPVELPSPAASALPWGLVAAAAIAGLAVGLTGGYQVGLGRGAARAATTSTASTGAAPGAATQLPGSGTSGETPGRTGRTAEAAGVNAAAGRNATAPGTDTEVAIGARGAPVPGAEVLPAEPPARVPSDVRRARAAAGRLTIRSTPTRALVSVDGRHVGETPITLGDLALGGHVVQVARPGYAPHQQRVSLTSASPAQTLVIALSPGLPTSGGSGTRGKLEPDSEPSGASASMDSLMVGTSPLRGNSLAAGTRVVRFALLGFRPATTRTLIEAWQPAGVRADLGR